MADQNIDIVLKAHDRYSKEFTKLQKAQQRVNAAMRKAAGVMKVAAVMWVAAVAATVKAAADFEKQLATVSTMLDDQTSKFLPKYAKALDSMAIEFGESTATLSKGLYDILSASVPAAKALDVLDVSARAAKAGLVTTGIAADAITTVLNSFSLSADKAGDVSDWFFTIVKAGKTTMAELAPNIGKVASVAAQAGLSLEETGAAMATLTKAGIRTEMATTGLASILMSLLKPTDAAAAAFKEKLGISLDAATISAEGLTGIIRRIREEGLTAKEVMEMFPEKETFKVLAPLIANYDGLLEDTISLTNRAGATTKAYNKMTAIFTHQWNQLIQTLLSLARTVGIHIMPALSEMFEGIRGNAGVLKDLAVFLGRASAGIIRMMTLLGKPVQMAIDSFIKKTEEEKEAIKSTTEELKKQEEQRAKMAGAVEGAPLGPPEEMMEATRAYYEFVSEMELGGAEARRELQQLELDEAEAALQTKMSMSDQEYANWKKNTQTGMKVSQARAQYEAKLAAQERNLKLGMAQDILQNTLTAVVTLLGGEEQAFSKRKALILGLIAMEKALAIARELRAAAGGGPLAWAKAIAKSAVIAATFAAQARGATAAAARAEAGPGITAVTPAEGILPGERAPAIGAAALPARGGGGAMQVTINVGGVDVALNIEQLASLEVENADDMLRSLGEVMKHQTNAAIQFALQSANLASLNREMAT